MVPRIEDGYYPTLTNPRGFGRGYQFFCRNCGVIWAKLETRHTGEWFVSNTNCLNHGNGSIRLCFTSFEFESNPVACINALPENLLIYETLVKIHHLLKG